LRLRRRWILPLAVLFVVVAASASRASLSYNTTDPTVFAPHCLNPLHRDRKHCLDSSTVGGVSLTGSTKTIEIGTGERYQFRVDVPKRCPADLTGFKAGCTVSVEWGVLYGASLADWGLAVQDTVEPHIVSGCDGNDLTCVFTVEHPTGPTGAPLPDGTALRVTADAVVVNAPCGRTANGYCGHWMDWPMRLRTKAPNLEVDWTMPSRLTDSESASWSASDDGVAPASYVYPKDGWTVNLFVTSDDKETCPAGDTFKWTLKGGGKTITAPDEGCKVKVSVPSLGVYDVTAKEYAHGVATGTTIENQKVIVRDWLIIGMGDSNGSGQGNPPYLDRQCDRGVTSYQYQTAQYVETHDPRSSVTFLFASCSGARTDHLWQNMYAGQEPGQGSPLQPQIHQIEERVDTDRPERPVDAAIISIGINNLQFGSIMAYCAGQLGCNREHVRAIPNASGDVAFETSTNPADPTLAQDIAKRLDALPAAYDELNAHLKTLDPAHVFLTQYPDETTSDSGARCSVTQGRFPAMLTSVWQWLHETGTGLNSAVAKTSRFGWDPVTGIPERFSGHGYCASDSYFRGIAGSVATQHNLFGSFHADASGQAITYEQTRARVCQALYGNQTCDGIPPASK
jgi:hypothetical protein